MALLNFTRFMQAHLSGLSWGVGLVGSSSLSLLPPHTFPCLSVGSLSQDAVLHDLLLFFAQGTVLQDQTAPLWVPFGLLFWPGACSSVLQLPSGHVHQLQRGVLHELQGGPLLQRGPLRAAGEQPASPWSSPQAREKSLLWCLEHVLHPFLPLTLH